MGGSILLLIIPLQPDPLLPSPPASPRLGIFNATGWGWGIFLMFYSFPVDVSAEVSGEKWQMQIVTNTFGWGAVVAYQAGKIFMSLNLRNYSVIVRHSWLVLVAAFHSGAIFLPFFFWQTTQLWVTNTLSRAELLLRSSNSLSSMEN